MDARRGTLENMGHDEGLLQPEGLQASLFFETPEEIYARVFRQLKPRTAVPEIGVEFCRFANVDSFIRLEEGRLRVRISDLLAGAPAPMRISESDAVGAVSVPISGFVMTVCSGVMA